MNAVGQAVQFWYGSMVCNFSTLSFASFFPSPFCNSRFSEATDRVHNLLEVDCHTRAVQVEVVRGVVNELRHLVQPQLHSQSRDS